MQDNIEKDTRIPLMLGIIPTADRYGLSQNYIRQLLLSGKVKGVRVGRNKLLCNCNDLERFLNNSYASEPAPVTHSGIKPISVKV